MFTRMPDLMRTRSGTTTTIIIIIITTTLSEGRDEQAYLVKQLVFKQSRDLENSHRPSGREHADLTSVSHLRVAAEHVHTARCCPLVSEGLGPRGAAVYYWAASSGRRVAFRSRGFYRSVAFGVHENIQLPPELSVGVSCEASRC